MAITTEGRRYAASLSTYLDRGFAIRYRYEMIGSARIFFPYINDTQFQFFQERQKVLPLSSLKDNSLGSHSSLSSLSSSFSIVGNVGTSGDYLLYVSQGKAGYIRLEGNISFHNHIDTHKDRQGNYINLQEILFRDLSIASRENNGQAVYYRTLHKSDGLYFEDSPLPFEVIYSVLSSGSFSKELLFIQYVLQQLTTYKVNEITSWLYRFRKRFVQSIKRVDASASESMLSQEWSFHTKLLFEYILSSSKLSSQQVHAINTIIAYCAEGIKITAVSNTGGIPPHFSHIKLSTLQVRKLYQELITSGTITSSVSEDDFVYYLKGEGKVYPTNKIEWTDSTTRLTIFINVITTKNAELEWLVASNVIKSSKSGDLKRTTLKNLYAKTSKYRYSHNGHHRDFSDLVSKL